MPLTLTFNEGFCSWMKRASLLLQWKSNLPDAKKCQNDPILCCDQWFSQDQQWLALLARALKCSVFCHGVSVLFCQRKIHYRPSNQI